MLLEFNRQIWECEIVYLMMRGFWPILYNFTERIEILRHECNYTKKEIRNLGINSTSFSNL